MCGQSKQYMSIKVFYKKSKFISTKWELIKTIIIGTIIIIVIRYRYNILLCLIKIPLFYGICPGFWYDWNKVK